jgi:nucleotide-binding universal stress UspA family protein
MESPQRTFLVASSLEIASDKVVRTALATARASGADLHFFHAHTLPVAYFAGPTGMTTVSAGLLDTERNLRERMVDVQLARVGATREDLASVVIQAGAPHRLIHDTAEELGAELLFLGSNEHPDRLLHGSTTDRVLRKTTLPVWVVNGTAEDTPKQLLAPVDLSPLSAHSLERGLELVKSLGPEVSTPIPLRALFVLTDEERQSSLQFSGEQLERLADEELGRFVDKLTGLAGRPVVRVVRVGDIRGEILREVEEESCDLMILGTHGRSGFERFLLGSVASDMAGRSPCDVLVIPPHETDED